jgi:hypothetical protein
MFVVMCKNASKTAKDSTYNVVFDFFCLIRLCGFRVAKYTQTTQSNIGFHKYPSGNRITKGFLPTDWVFWGAKNTLIKVRPKKQQLQTTQTTQNNILHPGEQTEWSIYYCPCSRGSGPFVPSIFLFRQGTFSVLDGLTASCVTKTQKDKQQTASNFLTPWKSPPPMIAKFCSLLSGARGLIH